MFCPGKLWWTFTEKAARELLTRISDEFSQRGIDVNANEMYIGTFHSVCLRILDENADYAKENKKCRIIDSFETLYLICGNMSRFEYLGGFEEHFPPKMGVWKRSAEICRYVSQLTEELADIDAMENDKDEDMRLLAKLVRRYREVLESNNVMDFSSIQTRTYEILKGNPEELEKLCSSIKYIMVDEYQDTNYIQEQLVFMLAGERQNICVVGDDDQGMYRFRGATIRNILEFPHKFSEGKCSIIHLDINYRSEPDIINFYSRWMENADGVTLFNWDKYRYLKSLKSGRTDEQLCNAVFRCEGDDPEAKKAEVLKMVQRLKSSGQISDYNQIAFLFRSVKSDEATELAAYLEENGVPVYSPRSKAFFERTEVKQLLGCLILCFKEYFGKLKKNDFLYHISDKMREYYKKCVKESTVLVKTDTALYNYINSEMKWINELCYESNKSMLDIFYKIISFDPFRKYMSADLNDTVIETRAARNLSEISRMLSKFGYLHNMQLLDESNKIALPEQLFNVFIRFHFIDGIGEYEDMSEYAPHGCVSFMTIHQSKGLEFPVVVVGSMSARPCRTSDILLYQAERRFFNRRPFEPLENIQFFDFWRLYYTAFSRAQDILVLYGQSGCFGVFEDYAKLLPNISRTEIGHKKLTEIKKVRIKQMYSFTSHISLYDGCPKQYKFYKEYAFAQHKMLHTSIGSLVHATLEDINNIVISKASDRITEDDANRLFEKNLAEISGQTGYVLDDEQRKNALGHIMRYIKNRKNELFKAWRAEEEIILVRDKFILQGIVDLIEYNEDSDTLEIIDYKTGPMPDYENDPKSVSHYKKQLEIYAYLIGQRFGKKVTGMHLYYTGETVRSPFVTFEYRQENIDRTIDEINSTVGSIESRNFEGDVTNSYACRFCDMKYLCGKSDVMEEFLK